MTDYAQGDKMATRLWCSWVSHHALWLNARPSLEQRRNIGGTFAPVQARSAKFDNPLDQPFRVQNHTQWFNWAIL